MPKSVQGKSIDRNQSDEIMRSFYDALDRELSHPGGKDQYDRIAQYLAVANQHNPAFRSTVLERKIETLLELRGNPETASNKEFYELRHQIHNLVRGKLHH